MPEHADNPTTKVHETRARVHRDLCVRWKPYCITDEIIYEHILYDGAETPFLWRAQSRAMRDRTIVSTSLVKNVYRP